MIYTQKEDWRRDEMILTLIYYDIIYIFNFDESEGGNKKRKRVWSIELGNNLLEDE